MKALKIVLPLFVLAGMAAMLMRSMSSVMVSVPESSFTYMDHHFEVRVLPADIVVLMDGEEYAAGRLRDLQGAGGLPDMGVTSQALAPFHHFIAGEILEADMIGLPSDGVGELAGRLPTQGDGPNQAASWCWEASPGGSAFIGCHGLYTPDSLVWSFVALSGVVADARFVNDSTALVVEANLGGSGAGVAYLVTTSGTVLWKTSKGNEVLVAGEPGGPYSAYVNDTHPDYVALLDIGSSYDGIPGNPEVHLIQRARPGEVLTYTTGWPWPDSVVQAFMPPPPDVLQFKRNPSTWMGWIDLDGTEASGGRVIVGTRWQEPPGDSVLVEAFDVGGDSYSIRVEASSASRDPILLERGMGAPDLLVTNHRYAVSLTHDGAESARFALERHRLVRQGVIPWDGERAYAPTPLAVLPGRGVLFQGRREPSTDLVELTPGDEWIFAVGLDGQLLASGLGRTGWCPDPPEVSPDGAYVLSCSQLFDLDRRTVVDLVPRGEVGVAARFTGDGRLLVLTGWKDGGPGRVSLVDLEGTVLEEASHGGFFRDGRHWPNVFPWDEGGWVVLDQYYCREPAQILMVKDGVITSLPSPKRVETGAPEPGGAISLPELTVPMPCHDEASRRFFIDKEAGEAFYTVIPADVGGG